MSLATRPGIDLGVARDRGLAHAVRVVCIALLSPALMSCASRPTQLLVVVDTDFRIPSQLTSVTLRTERPDGSPISSREMPLSDQGEMPFSFGVVPLDGDASRAVVVVAEGYRGDALVASHRVRTGFLAGLTLLLRLHLRRCAPDPCFEEESISPESLERVEPGQELNFDAGVAPQDSGTPQDAGDAGSLDAGPDADTPRIDAGPRAPASCRDHRDAGSATDGVYEIDVDGPGGLAPYDVFCEMDAAGGGWTLLLKVDGFEAPPGGPSQLGYDSPLWTGTEELNAGSLSRTREEALLAPYHSLPITELHVEMYRTATTTVEVDLLGLAGGPLVAAIRRDTYFAMGDLASWGRVVDQDLGTLPCARAGINVQMADAVFVRLGVVGSRLSDCSVAEGWFGIGAKVLAQPSCSIVSNTAGGGRLCGAPGRRGAFDRFATVFGR